MFPYFARKFSAEVAGRRLRGVWCEKCGTLYSFELARVGVAVASAHYGLGQGAARHRADEDAEDDLDRRLSRDTELVPCPRCNWVNDELVVRWRSRLYPRVWIPIALTLTLTGGLLAWLPIVANLRDVEGLGQRGRTTLAFGCLALVALSPLAILWFREVLRRRKVDPNASYPHAPRLPPGTPPGTPPALIRQVDPQTGLAAVAPFGRREAAHASGVARPWAVFRAEQIAFPATCCLCLAPSRREWSTPLGASEGHRCPAPLCLECHARLRRAWWMTVPWIVLVAAVGAAGVMTALEHLHWGSAAVRSVAGVGLMVCGVGLGVAFVPSWRCRPSRVKVIDADRRVFGFRASNPAYTRLVIAQIEADDGVGDGPEARPDDGRADAT